MKLRTSFVTNSSSSSFIVAHNNNFTEEQRDSLADFALKNFLGNTTCSTEEELVNYFNKTYRLKLKVGEFTDSNGNIKDLFEADESLKDEFIEEYDGYEYELHSYLKCLKAIKEGYSISLGWLSFEDDMPIYTLQKLQQKFWKVLSNSDNFKTIEDDLDY